MGGSPNVLPPTASRTRPMCLSRTSQSRRRRTPRSTATLLAERPPRCSACEPVQTTRRSASTPTCRAVLCIAAVLCFYSAVLCCALLFFWAANGRGQRLAPFSSFLPQDEVRFESILLTG